MFYKNINIINLIVNFAINFARKIAKNVHLLIFFLTVLNFNCYSQFNFKKFDLKDIKYGFFIGAASIFNSVEVNNYPAFSEFPKGTAHGSSLGGYYGLFAGLPAFELNKKEIIAGLRVSILDNQVNLTFNKNHNWEDKKFDVTSTFSWVSLAPLLQYNFWNNFVGLFGVQFNIPIISEFSIHSENFNQAAKFENPTTNLRLQLGIGYSLPLPFAKDYVIIPEINALISANNSIGGEFAGSWKSHFFTVGFTVQNDRKIKHEIDMNRFYDEKFEIDTVKQFADKGADRIIIGKPQFIDSTVTQIDEKTAQITNNYKRTDTLLLSKQNLFEIEAEAFAVEQNGAESVVNRTFHVTVDEVLTVMQLPLLNYIFFEQGSSKISNKYTLLTPEDAVLFSESNIIGANNMAAYYQILNVIGKRMQNDTTYTLRIEGCNDNYSADEKDNLELSNARAEAIKNYFRRVWKINNNRLTVTSRGLPDKPSLRETEPLKMQENRRVDLIPNDYSLFDPIKLESRTVLNPIEKIKFNAKIFSVNEISNYTITVSCEDEIVHTVSVNNPQKVDETVEINEEWAMKFLPERKRSDYKILLIATNKLNNSKSYRLNFPVYFNTAEDLARLGKNKQINKYNLILFDFSTATIGSRNARIIADIQSRTHLESPVTVEGFADITGSEDFNNRLSLQRAETVKNALKLPNSQVISSENPTLLYDNDTPEGRFYCRTVEITVMPPQQ